MLRHLRRPSYFEDSGPRRRAEARTRGLGLSEFRAGLPRSIGKPAARLRSRLVNSLGDKIGIDQAQAKYTVAGLQKLLLAFNRARKVTRKAYPTTAVIDSQSVKSAETGGSIYPPGYDGGKKIKGKKCHILVDMTGLMLHAIVHAADIQDRDGDMMVMATLFGLYPFLLNLYAGGG